jgi:hypothetical protein
MLLRGHRERMTKDGKEKMNEIACALFRWALWAAKHFGTGIIGTAFI